MFPLGHVVGDYLRILLVGDSLWMDVRDVVVSLVSHSGFPSVVW